MPDLGGATNTLLNSETLTLTRRPNSLLNPPPTPPLSPPTNHLLKTLTPPDDSNFPQIMPEPAPKPFILKFKLSKMSSIDDKKILDDYVRDWKLRRIAAGVPENRCFLPFLVGAPRLVECRVCSSYIYPGDEVCCAVRGCQGIYHMKCAKENFRWSTLKKFKCPHHECFICKQKFFWRCMRCEIASHDKCAAWPDKVIHLGERPGWAVCWRHPEDWREDKHEASTSSFEDIFARLPLPYIEEEFKMDSTLKEGSPDTMEPPSYVHIRRNVYLVKKKRDDACADIGCTCRSAVCSEDCLCWVQSIGCSKACQCSEACSNRPFRKEKKLKVVKTDLCGWGVETAEPINKGDFVIEYVGEVVDDVECTRRLWDMKKKDVKNFYMCEIGKDFTIDATFKGNASRFLNHSCEPNCKMEKCVEDYVETASPPTQPEQTKGHRQVEGETRVGVFAARSIDAGESLTYDYRFVQFGPEVKCQCGAAKCLGYLGAKRKINLHVLDSKRKMPLAGLSWGSKRRRAVVPQMGLLPQLL